nr:MAG TPA: hypothetical protein [Caudoviricetes sp.]
MLTGRGTFLTSSGTAIFLPLNHFNIVLLLY